MIRRLLIFFTLFVYMFASDEIPYTCSNLPELTMEKIVPNKIWICKEKGVKLTYKEAVQDSKNLYQGILSDASYCESVCANESNLSYQECVKFFLKSFSESYNKGFNEVITIDNCILKKEQFVDIEKIMKDENLSYTCNKIEEFFIQVSVNYEMEKCRKHGIDLDRYMTTQFIHKNPNFAKYEDMCHISKEICRETKNCLKLILKHFKIGLKSIDSNQSSQEERDECIGIIEHANNNYRKGLTEDEILFLDAEKAYKQQDYDSAINLFNKTLNFNISKNKYNKIYNSLGLIFYQKNEYSTSLDFFNKVLNNNPNPLTESSIYNNIALIYMDLGKYDDAFNLYQKSLKIGERNLGKDNIFFNKKYNNIGILYFSIKDYKQASKYLIKSFNLNVKKRKYYSLILPNKEKKKYLHKNNYLLNILTQTAS